MWAHADDSAFGNLWTFSVTHEGDQAGSGGQGFTGVIDDAAFYNIALTEEQVLAHFEDGFSGMPEKIEITGQPQDATVPENAVATFSVDISGMPVIDVKWLVNGEEVATDSVLSSSSFSIVATEANNGAKVKAELTNKAGSISTAEAKLTTVIDKDAPEVTSITAYAGTLNQIIITFNEPLNATTAANTANYKIDGLEVSSAEVSEAVSYTHLTLPTKQMV